MGEGGVIPDLYGSIKISASNMIRKWVVINIVLQTLGKALIVAVVTKLSHSLGESYCKLVFMGGPRAAEALFGT